MSSDKPFTFEISLSVLNHLGRSLYRSFATVLGEAISNSWDADAKNVWIYLDGAANGFWIKDDGIGMTSEDFQNKFLKIGYSKRKGGKKCSQRGRPFIGRKGIGKLALLSCAERITVVSKVRNGEYVGGAIDNPELDDAITEDLTTQEYVLGAPDIDSDPFGEYTKDHKQGTIIHFQNLNDTVRRSFDFLAKMIALYFRFSLLDKSFVIFLNGEKITHNNLSDLAERTEFLWRIGNAPDPFVKSLEKAFSKDKSGHESKNLQIAGASGFIASVKKPRDLKIMTTDERVGIDLFVNGRLRERDILKHIPTARLVESYLYGQIHFDALDDKTDRFTSSREGIVADDPTFKSFLERFKKAVSVVVEDWDKWRIKHREEGDAENERIPKTERASRGLYNAVSKEYESPKDSKTPRKVDGWVDDLSADATFNFESYAECFISENLVRKFITDRRIPLSEEASKVAERWKNTEAANKNKGNISIEIRRTDKKLSYLSMDDLANLVDKKDKIKDACLARDAAEFKPIRDAVAHTALLTDAAKKKLASVRENIKGRVRALLSAGK
ncbi:MAG: ATP-binding protein [Sedimentisphaerales bacterium]|nr:ATP-binding protein [Sedimentisphaerales bacterium]